MAIIDNTIRKPAVAGMFYPIDPEELKVEIKKFAQNASLSKVELPKETIRGIISPHAGYAYSGQCAAYSYDAVKNLSPEIIVVLSPSHRESLKSSTVYNGKFYETPLGLVKVHTGLAKKLEDPHNLIHYSCQGHIFEHALEVQLPFIQHYFPNASIIPIVVGNISPEHTRLLADKLYETLKNYSNVLFVASTDLSHFHPYNKAVDMDSKFISILESLGIEELEKNIFDGTVEACGIGPVAVVAKVLMKEKRYSFKKLYYCNSGDVINEKRRVVGYLSGVFT